MQGLTQPELLLKPFAQNGTKNTIPVTNTDTTNPQKADLTNGFPAITSMEPDDGGLPAERADFNGLGYLTTTYDYFAQAGGKYTFNQTVSTAIGGYPLNARLWYFNGTESQILRSTKNNNDDNFVSNPSFIGTSWVKDTPTMTDLTTRVPASVGSGDKPVYTNSSGNVTASNSTVGNNRQPVYMSNGTITACDSLSTVLGAVYPVGSIYIGTQASCPLASLISGSTWTKIEGRYLLASGTLAGTSETYSATNTVASGTPNITGVTGSYGHHGGAFSGSGAFYEIEKGWGIGDSDPNSPIIGFDASRSNNIYGSSDAVRAPAYVVNVWRRTA